MMITISVEKTRMRTFGSRSRKYGRMLKITAPTIGPISKPVPPDQNHQQGIDCVADGEHFWRYDLRIGHAKRAADCRNWRTEHEGLEALTKHIDADRLGEMAVLPDAFRRRAEVRVSHRVEHQHDQDEGCGTDEEVGLRIGHHQGADLDHRESEDPERPFSEIASN